MPTARDASYQALNYTKQGGDTTIIGGTLDIATGGVLKIDGVDQTAALATAPAAVAAGYKIARGSTALDGSNPTPVTTGLTTIVSATVSLRGTSAPGVGTSVLTTGVSSGTLNVYAWKVTGSGDCTLIASTGTETFDWIAVGT